MSARELNKQVLEQLGSGDTVTPREMLKSRVLAILEALDTSEGHERASNLAGEERADTFIQGLSDELEHFLGVAFPLIEYGGPVGQDAVVRGLTAVTAETAREPSRENAMYLVTARLLWSTAAFALACDAIDFLPRLLGLTVHSAFRDADERLIDDSGARHLTAYGRSADVSFDSHWRWLASLRLLDECYPLLARSQRLEHALMEADMLSAMHTDAAGAGINGTYSHGAHRQGQAERLLRVRLVTPGQRKEICQFFGVPESELEETLAQLHEGLRRNRDLFLGDVRLFPGR